MPENESNRMGPLVRASAKYAACKCCGTISPLFGVVDFHKNCELNRGRDVLELAGFPIYYYRCPRCAFLFTTAFDAFKPHELQRYIYNEDYAIVDPDYLDERPRSFAQLVQSMFPRTPDLRFLTYGGGTGRLADELKENGIKNVDVYDPFVERYSAAPDRTYDCILCIEVVEHSLDPKKLFEEMKSLMAEGGMVLFTTLLQPDDLEEMGVSWWYVAPRNGHVSLFTQEALLELAGPLGLQVQSFNENLHVLFRDVPPFAAHLFENDR